MKPLHILCCAIAIAQLSASAESIRVLAWNIESDGSDTEVISDELSELNEGNKYAVIGLSEVPAAASEVLRNACGSTYQVVQGQTGRNDRLVLLFDTSRFDIVASADVHEHDGLPLNFRNQQREWRFRSPLVVHLRSKADAADTLFVVNHLARGQDDLREKQAKALREWAKDQALPSITLGDFNFDYDITDNEGNASYEELIRDGHWKWIKPNPLVDTNWADNNGSDRFPNTILDFFFASGPARNWPASSRVIVRPGDFPDNDETSDHRPVEATFETVPQTPIAGGPKPALNLGWRRLGNALDAEPDVAPSTASSPRNETRRALIAKKIELLKAEIELLELQLGRP